MQFRRIALGAGAALLLMPAVSFAQAPPQSKSQAAPPKGVHDPQACADANVTAGKGANGKLGEQKGQTLSDKLARSKGVICPPSHVDPEIKAPTPQGGPMPVIPPPGSPGGNPNVQPK